MKKGSFIKKEVAEITGLKPTSVHFYTNNGLVIPDIENPSGKGTTRKYSSGNIVEFFLIIELKSLGLNLNAIEEIMNFVRQSRLKNTSWWSESIDGKQPKKYAYAIVWKNGDEITKTTLHSCPKGVGHLWKANDQPITLEYLMSGQTMMIVIDITKLVVEISSKF